jgi:hypothetical protein
MMTTLGPPFSTRRMQAADWANVRYFRPQDFKRPDLMGYEFVLWLDLLRTRCGFAINISSDARTLEHNKEVGGALNSAHVIDESDPKESCNAVDIRKEPRTDDPNWNYSRWKIVQTAMVMGCMRIGIYPNGSLHIDRTEHERAAPRLWIQVDNPA